MVHGVRLGWSWLVLGGLLATRAFGQDFRVDNECSSARRKSRRSKR